MKALDTLSNQVWLSYAIENDEFQSSQKKAFAYTIPFPFFSAGALLFDDPELFAFSSIFAGFFGLWFLFVTLGTIGYEVDVRKIVKKGVSEHIKDALDEKNEDVTLVSRFEKKGVEHHWDSLSPRHLRWIENVRKTALEQETKTRAEQKILESKKAESNSISAINALGDSEARDIREVKEFLNGLHTVREQPVLSQKELDAKEFDKQMEALGS